MTTMMTFASFQQIAEEQRSRDPGRFIIPVFKRLSADLLTPVSAFLLLRENSKFGFLLESVEGGEKLARYSFLGKNPYRIVKAFGESVVVNTRDPAANGKETAYSGDIIAVLRQMLAEYKEVKIPDLPRFASGAVGYMGYDVIRRIENLPDGPQESLGFPDAVWCFYDAIIAFDHVKHQLILMATAFVEPETRLEEAYDIASAKIEELTRELAQPMYHIPEPVTFSDGAIRSNFSRPGFEQAVEEAKRYIYEGDIFQVVLSQRFQMNFSGDHFNLYRSLRQVNPSPYLFYLAFEHFALIGSSPEVLVRVENGRAEVLPIAGTRRRGNTKEEDEALEKELLADEKECAEHIMLVDLGRNDLGRVCKYGTVQVNRFSFVERYSHVMHIVSSVSGILPAERNAMDVLSACFPAGTVSGAPKVRAMQIIDELEPTKRGVYAGAVGYVDFSGNLDTCIAIRTMIVCDNVVYVQAGAGIVADSDPAKEYEETENKARALREAMLAASEGLLSST